MKPQLNPWVRAALIVLGLALGILSVPLLAQTNLLNTPIKLDSTGGIVVGFNGALGTIGQPRNAANTPVRLDSNGALVVAFSGITYNALGTTSTDGIVLQNTTASTAGVPVQISPRMKWCGTAYNSVSTLSETDCFFIEDLPTTVAGTTIATLKIGYIAPSGAVTYPATLASTGGLNLSDTITAGTYNIAAAAIIRWNARSILSSTADKLLLASDNAIATGEEFNLGSPTLGTCTGGTIVSGSHNFGGEVTGNTSGSCIINFGTPNWTNTPFCVLNDESSLTAIRISARSASSITVTGTPSGEAFQYVCVGRIGT